MYHKLWYVDAAQAAFREHVLRVLCAAVLENFKYRPIMESDEQKVSSSRTFVSFIIGASIKRFCMGALLMIMSTVLCGAWKL
jgi:hypothetical protein